MKVNKSAENVGAARGPAARILVVSEVCSPDKNALVRPLKNLNGDRLRRLFGLSEADYDACMNRVTLCFGKWHPTEARQSAKKILSSIYGKNGVRGGYDVLIMVGSKVREIFTGAGVGHVDYFGYRTAAGCKVVSLPHPSGRSRAWNDPSARTRAISVMSVVAPWVPWGKWSPGMTLQKLGVGKYNLVFPKRGTRQYDQMLGAALPEEGASDAIGDVAAEMYRIAAAHGFHEKHVQGQVPEDFGAFCMNLVGEVSELWEAYREGRLGDQCDKKCELTCAEEELADTMIRCMDTAVQLGVDLGRAVARKAAYNRTRPYKHGNKRA